MTAVAHREVERKYEVPEGAESRIDWSGLPGHTVSAEPVEHRMEAVYFDTEDMALGRRSVALRRRRGGADDGWHVKFSEATGRQEWQVPLLRTPDRMPAAVRHLLAGLTGGEALRPIATLRTVRRVLVVSAADGDDVAELAADVVEAVDERTGTARSWSEWEVELLDGSIPEDRQEEIFDAVESAIFAVGGRRSSSRAKIARALGAEDGPGGTPGAAVIESVLDEFPLLEKVVLCDCGISNEDMAALNDRHENVRFVWRVYFSEFSLRTDDTNFIAARVRNEFPIYSYELEVLKYCPDLQALDLGHKNITSLDFLRYVPHLKYLIIVENDVNDITPIGELQELTYLEMFWTKCEDISPLQNCKALTDLNISYIYCRPAKCLETLVNMPQLERLWYCGNNLNTEQLEELQTALPNTEMYLAARGEPTGSTWREHPHYFEMRDFFGMYYMAGGTNGVDENGNQIIITG